jgi:hypothetical protein
MNWYRHTAMITNRTVQLTIRMTLMTYIFQYQARGMPHVYSLICIPNSDGIKQNSVESDDIVEQNKVKS